MAARGRDGREGFERSLIHLLPEPTYVCGADLAHTTNMMYALDIFINTKCMGWDYCRHIELF